MQNKSSWNDISLKAINSALEKLNRISTAKWESGNDVDKAEKIKNYNSICVYFDVKMEEDLLNFALFFNIKDIGDIVKYMSGHSFFVSDQITKKEEFLIGELGNIILNSLISALCNKVNISLIPSIPKVIQVEKEMAFDIITRDLPFTKGKRMFENTIILRCNEKNIFCEVYSFLPERIVNLIQE